MMLFRLDRGEGHYQMRPATDEEVKEWANAQIERKEPKFDLHAGFVGYGENDIQYAPVALKILPVYT